MVTLQIFAEGRMNNHSTIETIHGARGASQADRTLPLPLPVTCVSLCWPQSPAASRMMVPGASAHTQLPGAFLSPPPNSLLPFPLTARIAIP